MTDEERRQLLDMELIFRGNLVLNKLNSGSVGRVGLSDLFQVYLDLLHKRRKQREMRRT